jgi:CheY-like chemotaxis protein
LCGAGWIPKAIRIVDGFIVLIIEDEVLIRMDAVHMVEEAGFTVIEASSADEAINILEARCDIRGVFTDINMPGSMDGLHLSHTIRRRWPPIHLIITSGLGLSGREIPANARFLSKPYCAEHISAILKELFAPDRRPGQLASTMAAPVVR